MTICSLSDLHYGHASLLQEFSEYDKQGALLRQARNPIEFGGDGGDEAEGAAGYEDDEDDDLDFSGGNAGTCVCMNVRVCV